MKWNPLRKAVSYINMLKAAEQVVGNKGAPGIDQMTVDELPPYLKTHYSELAGSILNDSCRPKPVRRVEIPKPNGGVRLLGVPTVIDRMVQKAAA
jgi:RNA-directed DNA polymerase